MAELIEYKHPNGYSAILYGEASMSICFNGKEVSHTGFRSIHTKEQVMQMLEFYPEFRENLERVMDDILEDI